MKYTPLAYAAWSDNIVEAYLNMIHEDREINEDLFYRIVFFLRLFTASRLPWECPRDPEVIYWKTHRITKCM